MADLNKLVDDLSSLRAVHPESIAPKNKLVIMSENNLSMSNALCLQSRV